MNIRYETERLILMVGNESMAGAVNDYLVRNRTDFSRWDMHLSDGYFTVEYQIKALAAEQRLFLRGEGVRFYILPKENPDLVIGNISFAYLAAEPEKRQCLLGYKIDSAYRERGIAYEAASFLIPIIFKEFGPPRMYADILPENRASLALVKKLGFTYEGLIRNAYEIAGVKRDHLHFVLPSPHGDAPSDF